MITVFTPTYNRAHMLPALYESLKRQSYLAFEWLIVDDGSTDNTRDIVANWIDEGQLSIRYYCQMNGGKHRAINKGVGLAKGNWFFIVDSDDTLTENALESASKWMESVEDDETFAGVSGMRKIGGRATHVKFDVLDISPLRISNYIRADKAEIFKTEILKTYPFPDILGEMFCAESLIWNRIGLRYKLRYVNEVIYICHYFEDGLTRKSLRLRRESPTYSSMNYKEQMENMPTPKNKIRAAINYWRFVWFTKDYDKYRNIPLWAYLLLPIGVLFVMKDNKDLWR